MHQYRLFSRNFYSASFWRNLRSIGFLVLPWFAQWVLAHAYFDLRGYSMQNEGSLKFYRVNRSIPKGQAGRLGKSQEFSLAL